MSQPVRTIALAASAQEAAGLMSTHGVRHLVVVDKAGHAVGVVSDRDLRAAQPSVLLLTDVAMRDKALSLIRVGDVMAKHPHTAHPQQSVHTALGTMLRHRVGCLPVVSTDEQLVGIVTGGDVAKLALSLLDAVESSDER
ncbi:MAG: CBS domain-containing protein [Polyangiaceae bacterium]